MREEEAVVAVEVDLLRFDIDALSVEHSVGRDRHLSNNVSSNLRLSSKRM
jgi:hypothetical protein